MCHHQLHILTHTHTWGNSSYSFNASAQNNGIIAPPRCSTLYTLSYHIWVKCSQKNPTSRCKCTQKSRTHSKTQIIYKTTHTRTHTQHAFACVVYYGSTTRCITLANCSHVDLMKINYINWTIKIMIVHIMYVCMFGHANNIVLSGWVWSNNIHYIHRVLLWRVVYMWSILYLRALF